MVELFNKLESELLNKAILKLGSLLPNIVPNTNKKISGNKKVKNNATLSRKNRS
jgi:hypothetical protein